MQGFTVCPECGVEYDTEAATESESGAIQKLRQRCPECDETRVVGIVNYPDFNYEAITKPIEALDCDESVRAEESAFAATRCGDSAAYVVAAPGLAARGLCESHIGAHRLSAMEMEL